jgi:hypothetical protein
MRRRALITLAVAGALTLTGVGTAAPAGATEGVDSDALTELVTATTADAATWRSGGGSLAQRCEGSVQGASVTSSARMAYTGTGGVARLQYDLGEMVPGLGSGSTYYTGGRTAVTPITGVLRRALHKHSLAKVPAGYTTSSASNAQLYRQAGDLGSFLALDDLQDNAFWASLDMTVDGATTTWTGTTGQASGSAGVTLVRRGGHVVSYRSDADAAACTVTVSFVRPDLVVPAVSTRHNRLVTDEATLYQSLQMMHAFTAKKNGTTTVAKVRRWGKSLMDRRTEVTHVKKGIKVSQQSKGWKHPLVWKVTVAHGQARFKPVAS